MINGENTGGEEEGGVLNHETSMTETALGKSTSSSGRKECFSEVRDPRQQRKQVLLMTFAAFSTAATYIIIMFIAMPISVHLIVNTSQLGCQVGVDKDCFAPTSDSQTTYTLILTLLRLMTFLFGTLTGAASDRFGRKPFIMFALFGFGSTAVSFLIGWAGKVLAMFFVGGIILGISSPMLPHGIAYVTDISPREHLPANLGYLQGGGYFFGLMFGALVSFFISISTYQAEDAEVGQMGPYDQLFYISYGLGLALVAIATVVTWFGLPESLHEQEREEQMDWRKGNPIGFLFLILRSPYIFLIWLSAFCGWMAVGASEAVTAGWWLRRYAVLDLSAFIQFTVFIWVSSGLGSAVMTRLYSKFLGVKMTIHVSTLFLIALGVAFAFAPNVQISYLVVPLSFFSSSVYPATLTVLMGQIGHKERGAMAGTIRSSEALAKMLGIVLFGNMFSNFIKPFTPDSSCIPSTYPLDKSNTCDCGVESCPVFGELGQLSYVPSKCTLGDLSYAVQGKPSAHIEASAQYAMPVLPDIFISSGMMERPEECLGSGFVHQEEGFAIEGDRAWCVGLTAATGLFGGNQQLGNMTNNAIGCPGFDAQTIETDGKYAMNFQVCMANMTSTSCNQDQFLSVVNGTYSFNNKFPEALGMLERAMNGSKVCPEAGYGKLNICLAGPISSFPGFIPFLYMLCLPLLAYLFFIIAEVFFGRHDKKLWDHNNSAPTPDDA